MSRSGPGPAAPVTEPHTDVRGSAVPDESIQHDEANPGRRPDASTSSDAESRGLETASVSGAKYRHPATVLLVALVMASYLTLNLWGSRGDIVAHGFPIRWMIRKSAHVSPVEIVAFGGCSFPAYADGPLQWSDFRARLPLEWFAADFTQVDSIYLPGLFAALVGGLVLFLLLRRCFDFIFGLRIEPFRFGLRGLLIAMATFALLFSAATERRMIISAGMIVAVSLPFTLLGALAWAAEYEFRLARESAGPAPERTAVEESPDQGSGRS